jgi:outer membrane protein assembly factor BamB
MTSQAARPGPLPAPALLAWIALVGLAAAAPVAALQSSALFRGDPAHTGVYAEPGPGAGFVVLWRYQADGTVRSAPAVTGASVFVGTSGGSLLALDRADGALRWRYDAGAPLPSSPAVSDGMVVIAGRDGAVHAVDAATGEGLWRTAPTETLALPWGREGWDYWVSSPNVANGSVLIGSPDGRLLSLDLRSGDQLWSYRLGARTRSSPAISDGRVFIGDDAGVVHAVSLARGRPLWTHETEGAGMESSDFGWDRVSLQSSPAVAGGVLYIGSRDGGVYALDAETGDRLWYADHGSPWVVASAAVRNDTVWTGSSDGLFVVAIDAATGEEIWRTDVGARVFASPALAHGPGGGTLYVADHGGAIRAMDPATGEERWRFDVGETMIQSSPVPADDALFLGADDGGVYALGAGPVPPRMAVFWDSALSEQPFRAANAGLLRDYLRAHGYLMLGATALADWLEARIQDRAPSVLVFPTDRLPASAGDPDVPGTPPLLRRYLDAGGKVVWTGFPPWSLVVDPEGRLTGIDLDRTREALGIDAGRSGQGIYGARPTELGRAWGLEGTHLSELAVAPGPGVQVLAINERGDAAAVLRDYGGPPGTGLLLLWGVGAVVDSLDQIRDAAEVGVVRQP